MTTAKIADVNVTTAKIADVNVTTAKIADDAVTFAKIQNVTGPILIGRETATSGDMSALTVGNHLNLTSSTLNPKTNRLAAGFCSHNGLSAPFQNVVANTATETSLITNALSVSFVDPGGNSWPGIKANTLVSGSTFRITACGTMGIIANLQPSIRIRVKLGSSVVIDTAPTTGPYYASSFFLTGMFTIVDVGASGTSSGNLLCLIQNSSNSSTHTIHSATNTPVTVNTTIDQNFDITFQWGTASASNTVFVTNLMVERLF